MRCHKITALDDMNLMPIIISGSIQYKCWCHKNGTHFGAMRVQDETVGQQGMKGGTKVATFMLP